MNSFNHFDFLAPVYERFIKPTKPTKLSELLDLPVSGLLLDAAGGTGRKSFMLLGKAQGIIIADSSKGMLNQAKKKKGTISICCETECLPFIDGSFSRIIMVDAAHHVADYRATINELWRILLPGGRIVIEEPDISTFSVKVMAAIEKIALMRSHFISPQEIAKCFDYPGSEVNIEVENSTAWIIVNKPVSQV